MYIVE